jgi:hypothetical protein
MKTKRFLSTLLMFLVVAVSLSACSSNNITMKDIPLHPDGDESNSTSFITSLPWPTEESGQTTKLSDGPYKGYKVEGPNYYMFWKRDLVTTSLDDFYNSKLTEMGWTRGEASMYISQIGSMVVGEPWVKDNQVIFLSGYDNPMQSSVFILAIYLFTK